jgi:TolB-like protein/DNA-binding winged helix-turn-helix (wHTH) protein
MTNPADGLPSIYRFADLTLDTAQRRVLRDRETVELKALDFDLLRFLVESAPNVVNAEVLAEKVWARHFVSPENVAQRVMLLRQSLADDANRPRYIETIRSKGYRLIPAVQTSAAEPPPTAPARRRWLVAAGTLVAAVGVTATAGYWLGGVSEPPGPTPSSVAVLPFENLSPDPNDAFFAAGMQEEIVSQLTKISGLRVFLVRPTGGSQASIAEVARELNVATALGGSVYYSEGRVRVTPRLTQAASGATVWSQSYERELRDIFAIQSDVALDVARALSLELSARERERVQRVPTANAKARDLYLRAIARQWRDTPEEMLRAIREVEAALALDPAFIEAWVVDANMRTVVQFYDPQNAAEHRARGESAARRALELGPEFGNAHAALGFALSLMKDWTGGEAAYRRARSLNVPLADMAAYGVLQLAVGNYPFARQILEESRAAAPQNPTAHRFLMLANAAAGDWATATELYESGMSAFEPWREGPNQRMHWLVGRRQLAEARLVPMDDPFNASMLASLDAPDAALAQARHAYAVAGTGSPNLLRDISLWAGHFGDPVLALDALRAAVDQQGGQMVYAWLPQLAAMRRLPEFRVYARDLGLVAYWQKFGWPPACRPLAEESFECH